MSLTLPIYLDHNATTPVDPIVLDAMLPYLREHFGNAASQFHSFGQIARSAVEKARAQVATLLHAADPLEIIWTSGATESVNLALKGVAEAYADKGKHIITQATEHKAVLDTCTKLVRRGFQVTVLPVDRQGRVSVEQVAAALRPDTILVSIMLANNEIGTIQPVPQIARLCRERNVLFHTDATQALGKIPIDVQHDSIDLLSFSAHKMYGPKGCGGLYIRRRPAIRLSAQMDGGGHERGFRSGTLNVPGIVGTGAAAELGATRMADDARRQSELRDRLENAILRTIPQVTVNGGGERLPNTTNLSFAYVEGESILLAMDDVALSSGSACTSERLEPSHVLTALGIDPASAHCSIRFSLGRSTTTEQIDYTIEKLARQIARLRELSPLWEMAQEGIDPATVQWSGHGHH